MTLGSFRVDGRWIAAIVLGLYAMAVYILCSFIGEDKAWRMVGVTHLSPPFADLRVITSAVDCAGQGYDPLVNNPCDPWHRPMNYPRIWLFAAKALGLDASHTASAAIVMIALFFCTVSLFVGRLTFWQGIAVGLLLCSPPVTLAVERANTDLLIFVLLALGLVLMRRNDRALAPSLLFGFAAVLKLYPAAAIAGIARRMTWRAISVVAGFVGLFGFYLAAMHRDIAAVIAATPRPAKWAYGFRVIFDSISPHPPTGGKIVLFVTAVCLAATVLIQSSRRGFKIPLAARDSLCVGSAIYLGTFLLGTNWNYRLTLLLLLAPGAMIAIKETSNKLVGVFAVAAALLMFISRSANEPRIVFYLAQLVGWVVFVCALAIILELMRESFADWRRSNCQTATNGAAETNNR